MIKEKLQVVAHRFGKEYQNEFLYKDKEKQELQNSLTNDWYEALKFFFRKSFMGGRRKDLSHQFLDGALKALDEFNLKNKINEFKNNWKRESKALEKKLKEAGVNNQQDRKMVLSTIEFILKLKDYNLIKYCVDEIESKRIENLYMELDKIYGVGDKKVSLFLRDVVCVFDLEKKIENNKQIYLQPIDTWMEKIAEKLNIVEKSEIEKALNENRKSLEKARRVIVQRCKEAEVSPIEFSQGAWYIGVHAFDILIENLERFR